VKRVIGVPGDVLEMRDNKLFINDKAVEYEPLDPAAQKDFVRQIGPRAEEVIFAVETLDGVRHPMMKDPLLVNSKSSFPKTVVPPGKYFMMGDNRDNSKDSRWIGFVDRDQIVGRASRVVVSVDPQHGYKPRWDRFFAPLP